MVSHLLGRTAILPNIYEHESQMAWELSKDGHRYRKKQAFSFEDVFDDVKLSRFTKVMI